MPLYSCRNIISIFKTWRSLKEGLQMSAPAYRFLLSPRGLDIQTPREPFRKIKSAVGHPFSISFEIILWFEEMWCAQSLYKLPWVEETVAGSKSGELICVYLFRFIGLMHTLEVHYRMYNLGSLDRSPRF